MRTAHATLADRLQHELRLHTGSPAGTRPTRELALATAIRHFLAGDRVDMQVLAAQLGVGRATLYRWFGDREQLLGRVLWALSEQTLEWLVREATGSGEDRVLACTDAFMRVTSSFPPLRQFLAAEPAVALRALLGAQSPLIEGLNHWTACRLEANGVLRIGPREPSAEALASAIVSVTSTFCWASIVAGTEPDIPSAMRAVRVLLRAPVDGA